MKLKKVSNNKTNKNYKINISLNPFCKNEFFVGDKVLNKVDNIKGKISKIENNTIFVKYTDNTIERIDKNNAFEKLSYVDDIQTVIDPMSPQISKSITKVIDNLSKAGEIFDEQEINIDKDKLRIDQQYEELQAKKEYSNKISKIESLINLGISKGIIDKDDFELEKTKLSMMNDVDYKEYEDNILNFNSQSIVVSQTEEMDPNLTEAERALLQVKQGKNVVASQIDFSKVPNDSRSLEGLSNRQTFNPNVLNKKANVTLNNLSNNFEQSQYNNNSWMDELDWTLLSRN